MTGGRILYRWRKAITPFTANRRAAAAVEFAFVAPVFLVFILASVEVGRAIWIKSTMQFAVEQTARYAIVNTSAPTSALETYAATEIADAGFDDAGVTFTATTDTTGGVNFVTISASYDFTTVAGLIPTPDWTLLAMTRVPLD